MDRQARVSAQPHVERPGAVTHTHTPAHLRAHHHLLHVSSEKTVLGARTTVLLVSVMIFSAERDRWRRRLFWLLVLRLIEPHPFWSPEFVLLHHGLFP